MKPNTPATNKKPANIVAKKPEPAAAPSSELLNVCRDLLACHEEIHRMLSRRLVSLILPEKYAGLIERAKAEIARVSAN